MSVSNNFPTIRPSLSLDFANTKTLDPRITFTRSTTATCYDGVTTAMAEQNLLTYSQEFDNAAWTKSAVTVTANSTTAPDATSTADLITETATTSQHYIAQSTKTILAGDTYSVFFKLYGTPQNFMFFSSNQNYGVNIDVSTSPPTATNKNGTNVAQNIAVTDVGSGWYRLSFTAASNIGSVGYMIIWLSQNSANYLGDVAKGVYLWGAQLEQRSSATSYTPTTSQPITNYIPVLQTAAANVARFDHDPVTGESLGLLIEEQRTNLLTYSEQFDNAAWTKTAATITSNTIVAPDGTLTGDKLVCNSATTDTEKFTNRSIYSYVGQTVTGSVYLKKGEYTWVQVNMFNTSTYSNRVWINLDTGVVGTNLSSIPVTVTSVGNGWYRVALIATIQSAGAAFITVSLADADGDLYTNIGDQYSGVYLWGAQLEAGSFPTSYIPTTSAAVTRTADAASMTGENFSSWYRADEGTLYVNGSSISTVSSVYAALNNLSGSARITAFVRKIGNNGTSGIIANSAGTALLEGASYSGTADDKAITAYGTNSFATTGNAGSITQTTSGYVSAVTQMEIGRQTHLGSVASGTIKKIAYYPQRLTNTQLQALTA